MGVSIPLFKCTQRNFSHGNTYKPRRAVGGMGLKNKGFVPPLMLNMFFLCSFRDGYCYTVVPGGKNRHSEFEFRRKKCVLGNKERRFLVSEIGIVPEHVLSKPVFYDKTNNRAEQFLSCPANNLKANHFSPNNPEQWFVFIVCQESIFNSSSTFSKCISFSRESKDFEVITQDTCIEEVLPHIPEVFIFRC